METTRKVVTLFVLIALAFGVASVTGSVITAVSWAGFRIANALYDLDEGTARFVGNCLIYGIPAALFVVGGVKKGLDNRNGNR